MHILWSFIDDHSRKTWVYILKSKYVVLRVLKQFKVFKSEAGKKLKCICIDNEGEYLRPFDSYYVEIWIRHQKIYVGKCCC